jgi:plastocyanin
MITSSSNRAWLLAAAGLALAGQWAPAGDLTGTITLKGEPPKEKVITPYKDDINCRNLLPEAPTTRFYIVGPHGELADAVVSLQGISGKSAGASAKPVVLDQKNCLYVPQILAVQTGQKLIVKNSDPVMHNVDVQPASDSGNPARNDGQMPGAADLTFSFPKPEMFMRIKCDVHVWMFAWLSVFDHPYFAVSAKDGSFKIANVPPGKYTLQAAHRKAGTLAREVVVEEGQPAKADFTFELK